MKAGKIPVSGTEHFSKAGFDGNWYVKSAEKQGFNALSVVVHGAHPRKLIGEGNTRAYFVISGEGVFVLDGESHTANAGDMFIIPA